MRVLLENTLKQLKALFVLEVFQFLFRIFDHVGKRLDKKAKVNFRIYDVTYTTTNNYTYCQISQEIMAIRE